MRISKCYRWSAGILALGLMVGVSGCDSLLEVENPNNISGEDILQPAAAEGLVNGTAALVASGFSRMMNSYSTVTDELDWVGSRDSYREHDLGNLQDPFNEFTDGQYPDLAQARWMSDETLRVFADLIAVDSLPNDLLLARAHINRATIYAHIADFMDDFVIVADRHTGGPPLGESGMGTMYDEAASSAQTAMGVASAEGDSDLETLAAALYARALHGRAVWDIGGDRNNLQYTWLGDPTAGLVASTQARDAAVAALGMMGGIASDWVHHHLYSSSTVTNQLGNWTNERQENRISPVYATPDPDGRPTYVALSLEDVIDAGTISPILVEIVGEFESSANYSPLRAASAREMQLIIAEHELATNGNAAGFQTTMTALRALDGLSAYTGGDVSGNGAGTVASGVALLLHSRATNLFLQGRRLADHYRFSAPSAQWLSTSYAMGHPGTFLPLPVAECRSNPDIPDNCPPPP
ncbi:MAG: hypothetical protein ACYSUI_10170 [Planctomycetota bacterium]